MEKINRCNLIEEFINNSETEDFPASLKQHIEGCKDCYRKWGEYEQLLYDCREFPKIPISKELHNFLLNIPEYIDKRESESSVFIKEKYVGLMAVVSIFLMSFIVYFIFTNFEIPYIANNVIRRIDRYTHRAYSKAMKIYDTKNVLIGDIKYLSLPISMKIQEVFPKIVERDRKTNGASEEEGK